MNRVFRTLLFMISNRLDVLLVEYERSTPSIDQGLVRKTVSTIYLARKIAAILVLMLGFAAMPAHAFDHRENPDRYTSIGLDVSTGHLAGILTDNAAGAPATDGGFVKGTLDLRFPVSNALTLHAFGNATGVNNNVQFSQGNEVGVGLRVYLHD